MQVQGLAIVGAVVIDWRHWLFMTRSGGLELRVAEVDSHFAVDSTYSLNTVVKQIIQQHVLPNCTDELSCGLTQRH